MPLTSTRSMSIRTYGIGILHVSKFADYDRGIAAFELGLERNPEQTWLYMGIGTAQMRAGRFAEAEAALYGAKSPSNRR